MPPPTHTPTPTPISPIQLFFPRRLFSPFSFRTHLHWEIFTFPCYAKYNARKHPLFFLSLSSRFIVPLPLLRNHSCLSCLVISFVPFAPCIHSSIHPYMYSFRIPPHPRPFFVCVPRSVCVCRGNAPPTPTRDPCPDKRKGAGK